MKKNTFLYLFINILLAIIFYILINTYNWANASLKHFTSNSYIIISFSSVFVYFGALTAAIIDKGKILFMYLFCSLLKNAILLYGCYKYPQIVKELIVIICLIYIILMIIEIIFILKLNKYGKSTA